MNRAVLAAVDPGTTVRWLVVGTDPPCVDCAGNAKGPGVQAGDPFPSSHTAPPIHDGCRCLLVVEAG